MPRKTDADKILRIQRAFHREWLDNPATIEMKARAECFLEEKAESDSPAGRMMMSDRLVRLATWYGTSGHISLMDQNPLGWMQIHRSWLYLSLALRTRISVFQKGRVLGQLRPVKSLETEASASALCLAYALTVHRDFETRFFGDAVQGMLLDKDTVREAYWKHHFTEAFMIQLLALFRGENLNATKGPRHGLGVYQTVLDAWNTPSSLAEAIAIACDFHCERIEDKSNKFSAEFRSPPFDLVPAEIYAIYAVREAQGLDTPRVDHPLIAELYSVPAGSPDEVQDSLLDQVEATL